MKIEQFYDKGLAHGSYAIVSEGEMAVIDPARNPKIYYEFAEKNNAKIIAIIETHPHADFVSSHLEISKTTGAKIYVSKLLGAEYPHISFDDGDILKKPLNSIFVALRGDIQSIPDFDTNVTVSIENNYIILSISGNNMSKFRASLLSFLRLIDLAYSVLYIDK